MDSNVRDVLLAIAGVELDRRKRRPYAAKVKRVKGNLATLENGLIVTLSGDGAREGSEVVVLQTNGNPLAVKR